MPIHPTADVQSKKIGDGTSVWQFCVVLPGATIGQDCNICSHCFIENDCILGDRVTVKCGVQLWDGVTIEDDVFIGPNVTFTNDLYPRSKQHQPDVARTVIKRGASIGANATILPGLTIGADAMVGAGSVVTSSVPPGTVVAGNPGRILRYVNDPSSNGADGEGGATGTSQPSTGQPLTLGSWIAFNRVQDIRGNLTVAQWDQHLPFVPERVFFVHDVPSLRVRGEHAHKECQQVLLCLAGSVSVALDDGHRREQVELDRSDRGVLIPAGIWGTQYRYSSDATLAVFASHGYDEADYIRDYDQFLVYRQQMNQ